MYRERDVHTKDCPGKDVLSAYFDGELDPRSMDQISVHLSGCSLCRQRLEGFAVLRKRLNDVPFSLDLVASKERTLNLIEAQHVLRRAARRERFWDRRVFLPLPVVAAVGLLFMFTIAALIVWEMQPRTVEMAEIKDVDPVGPYDVDVKNLEQLAEFLKDSNSTIEVTIRLPSQPAFFLMGEPQLLRETEYKRGK